jgi:hypothetical protein
MGCLFQPFSAGFRKIQGPGFLGVKAPHLFQLNADFSPEYLLGAQGGRKQRQQDRDYTPAGKPGPAGKNTNYTNHTNHWYIIGVFRVGLSTLPRIVVS